MVSPKNLQLVWVLIFGFVVGFESFDLILSEFWFVVWILEFSRFDFGFRSLFLSACVIDRWTPTTALTRTATDVAGEPFLKGGRQRRLRILGNQSFWCGVETATKTSRTAPCTALMQTKSERVLKEKSESMRWKSEWGFEFFILNLIKTKPF